MSSLRGQRTSLMLQFLEISCVCILFHAIKFLEAVSIFHLVRHWPADRLSFWKHHAVFACGLFCVCQQGLAYSMELPFAVFLQLRSISLVWTHLSHLVRRVSLCRPLSSQTGKTFSNFCTWSGKFLVLNCMHCPVGIRLALTESQAPDTSNEVNCNSASCPALCLVPGRRQHDMLPFLVDGFCQVCGVLNGYSKLQLRHSGRKQRLFPGEEVSLWTQLWIDHLRVMDMPGRGISIM